MLECTAEPKKDENTKETDFIDCKVTNHEVLETNNQKYVSFAIKTTTNREEFKESLYVVERRFSDFDWLYRTLVDSQPYSIIPPLPPKQVINVQDKFGADFIEKRQRDLQEFLKWITHHPALSSTHAFQVFLTYPQTEFQSYKDANQASATYKQYVNTEKLKRYLQPRAFIASANQLLNNGVPSGSTSAASASLLNGPNPQCSYLDEFKAYNDSTKAYVNFCDRMNHLTSCIAHELQSVGKNMNELSIVLSNWPSDLLLAEDGEQAPDLSLLRFGALLESTPSSPMLLSGVTKQIAKATTEFSTLLSSENSRKWDALKRYGNAAKQSLDKRDNLSYDLQLANNRIEQKDRLDESIRSGTASRLALMLPQKDKESLVGAANRLQDASDLCTTHVRADYKRWQGERRTDTLNALEEMADAQMQYWTTCSKLWSDALDRLNSKKKA